MPALGDAAHTAGAIVRQGQEGAVQAFAPRIVKPLYAAVDPLKSWPTDKKLELLRRADAAARAAASRVIPVLCSLAGTYETILVAGRAGPRSDAVRPRVTMDVSVVIQHQGRREPERTSVREGK